MDEARPADAPVADQVQRQKRAGPARVAEGAQHEGAPQRSFIPLVYTRSSSAALPEIPRVFPEPPPIPRSPFRLPHPPPTLTSRLRPVANPLLLRLRALENLYGRAQVIEVKIREKVVGVAWEGIGRSGLGWELSVVC